MFLSAEALVGFAHISVPREGLDNWRVVGGTLSAGFLIPAHVGDILHVSHRALGLRNEP